MASRKIGKSIYEKYHKFHELLKFISFHIFLFSTFFIGFLKFYRISDYGIIAFREMMAYASESIYTNLETLILQKQIGKLEMKIGILQVRKIFAPF